MSWLERLFRRDDDAEVEKAEKTHEEAERAIKKAKQVNNMRPAVVELRRLERKGSRR